MDFITDRCSLEPGHYYVTLRRDARWALLLGPYPTHREALERVPDGRRLAEAADPWTAFDAVGTAALRPDADGRLPAGKLNAALAAELAAPAPAAAPRGRGRTVAHYRHHCERS